MTRSALLAAAFVLACNPSPQTRPHGPSGAEVTLAAPPEPPLPPRAATDPVTGQISVELADGCQADQERTLDVLPRRKGAGRLRIFTSPTGFDLFWLEVELLPSKGQQPIPTRQRKGLPLPHKRGPTKALFHQMWAPLSSAGKLLASPKRLPVPFFTRIASNGRDVVAIVSERTAKGVHTGKSSLWRCTHPDMQCRKTASLPDGPEGHGGGYGLAWDAKREQWGITWEEHRNVDPRKPGFVHSVLFFGRATATGQYVQGSTVQLSSSKPSRTASLSDWGSPMMWHPEHGFAVVWGFSDNDAKQTRVQLTHVGDGDAIRHTTVTSTSGSSRAVIAHDGARYGVAWQQSGGPHLNMRFSTVAFAADGAVTVGGPLIVGDDRVYSGGAILGGGNGTFVLGWHEPDADRHNRAFRMRVAGSPMVTAVEQLSDSGFAGDDWPVGLAFDGCRFAWAEQHHLNPSAARVRLFQ
jgi:hypothetical protein